MLDDIPDAPFASLFTHLTLPPRLPQEKEQNTDEIEGQLHKSLSNALHLLSRLSRQAKQRDFSSLVDSIVESIEASQPLSIDGKVDKVALAEQLKALRPGCFIFLHISAQNAGLFIQRTRQEPHGDVIIIEVFEASPRPQSVLAANGALVWDFPGSSIALPRSIVDDYDFSISFATFLEQASAESLGTFAAVIVKAGVQTVETRHTPDPDIITSFLTAVLEPIGHKLALPLTQKRVRDDVSFKQNMPWRRLPLWLVIRVSLARHFSLVSGHGLGRIQYKIVTAFFLAYLVPTITCHITPEDLVHCRAKISRRLAKLEVELCDVAPIVAEAARPIMNFLSKKFDAMFLDSGKILQKTWEGICRKTTMRIPKVEKYATAADMQLALETSFSAIEERLSRYNTPGRMSLGSGYAGPVHPVDPPQREFDGIRIYDLFEADRGCQELARSEMPSDHNGMESLCVEIQNGIESYSKKVGPAFDGNAQMKSEMIVTIMEAWVRMDQMNCVSYPLLRQFHPIFYPDMLDVLILLSVHDMNRARNIQTYLLSRVADAGRNAVGIFEDPGKGSFAERFYDTSDHLHALHDSIRDTNAMQREQKEWEWKQKKKSYTALTSRIARMDCVFEIDTVTQTPRHNAYRCERCLLQNEANRIRIKIHEDLLPDEHPEMTKAAVFELACPRMFSSYRDTTWFILKTTGYTYANLAMDGNRVAKDTVHTYHQLRPFSSAASKAKITLGSFEKSYVKSHYEFRYFPVECDVIFKPNALRYFYCDITPGVTIWPKRIRARPSFAHHCRPLLPTDSIFQAILKLNTFNADGSTISSYDISANQGRCPRAMNAHEFGALQGIFSGTRRRWLSILAELASTNINFSTDAVASLVSHVALQLGPWEAGDDALGSTHSLLLDADLCTKLLGELSHRLETIAVNWREIQIMGLIITLLLRIVDVGSAGEDAVKLLAKARLITSNWLAILGERAKVSNTVVAKQCQQYTAWIGLLCKYTYAYFVVTGSVLSPLDLKVFVECSIAVQNNLPKPEDMNATLKQAVIRDLRITVSFHQQICDTVRQHPQALLDGFLCAWPQEDGDRLEVDECQYSETDKSFKLTVKFPNTKARGSVELDYFIFTGVLCIDRQPRGPLTVDERHTVQLKEIFGSQALPTYPSRQPGMLHQLCILENQYCFHLGFDRGSMVLRAYRHGGKVLEYINREMFGRDLPGPLIQGHTHWLNLKQRTVEIYSCGPVGGLRAEYPRWTLYINTRQCIKSQRSPGAPLLVDPSSKLFGVISQILTPLESGEHLQVEQSPRLGATGFFQHSVVALLPRLNLRFRVNHRGRLQSSQPEAEVDPNQDIGTWYGLETKLVLRPMKNTTQPSASNQGKLIILVPLGIPISTGNGFAARCRLIAASGEMPSFGKFMVNSILGRIECAPEPRLLYTKALLHAITSGFFPDALTGRTGIEEAEALLASASCRPWTPLGDGPKGLLYEMAKLTPVREYYPPGHNHGASLKIDTWKDNMGVDAQSDHLRPLVEEILSISDELSTFYQPHSGRSAADTAKPSHMPTLQGSSELNYRAALRRQRFKPALLSSRPRPTAIDDPLYVPRDRAPVDSNRRRKVQEISWLVSRWPQDIYGAVELRKALAGQSLLDGFQEPFDSPLLSQRLDMDVKKSWGPLAMFAMGANINQKYSLMFLLCEAGFHPGADMNLIRAAFAFAIIEELATLTIPQLIEFPGFCPDQIYTEETWFDILINFTLPPAPCVAVDRFGFANTKQRTKVRKYLEKHERDARDDCREVASFIQSQWPLAKSPTLQDLGTTGLLLDLESIMAPIVLEWTRLQNNLALNTYLVAVENIIQQHQKDGDWEYQPMASPSGQPIIPVRSRGRERVALEDLASTATIDQSILDQALINTRRAATINNANRNNTNQSGLQQWQFKTENAGCQEIREILAPFGASSSHIRQRYASDLVNSIEAYSHHSKEEWSHALPSMNQAWNQSEQAHSAVVYLNKLTESCLNRPGSHSNNITSAALPWLIKGRMCATDINGSTLLQLLAGPKNVKFGPGVKQILVEYGLSVTILQRAQRIHSHLVSLTATLSNRYKDFGPVKAELLNPGHVNWDPAQYTDWLLLEIESDLMIRPRQVDVALATINPASKENSVLQMNMGEGKTSCIIPMAAAILADGRNIARVSVPKALLHQTGLLLHSKLAGLPCREIRHVPFSRRTPNDKNTINKFQEIHQDMRVKGGVMLCLPEHQLSLHLSGFQRLVDNNISQGNHVLKVQKWLTSNARDIIDESDYTLAVRTQLIYPSGHQVRVDGHPHRWLLVERVLCAVKYHLHDLQRRFPHSINVIYPGNGEFPLVFFLRPDVEQELVRTLTQEICDGHLDRILPVSQLSPSDRQVIQKFISLPLVEGTVLDAIKKLCPDKPSILQRVYHLRGLLVHRILIMALKKRWNVQYGLNPDRDPIAVPFHAKGVPSEMSEWGHPDVAILLTTLAFYYSGLTMAQLRQSLEHVFKSDDPFSEYDHWVQSSESTCFPGSLKDWNAINLDDTLQLADLHQALSYNMVAIDYYLNHFVFPVHSKQFKVKLQASGWDIPVFAADSQRHQGGNSGGNDDANSQGQQTPVVRHVSTGFSGTNDNSHMLPLTVKQHDLPTLSHTNAEVLTYLLQPRSRQYYLLADKNRHRFGEVQFLAKLHAMSIKVLIDAGAQILEMSNEVLAKTWLGIDGAALAALYFNPDNKAYIITRSGAQTPLLASPFVDNLNNVLVYLDQAHTRGTDLKFPAIACGALTLGLGQTKDATVQAAMRLRQLGTTQSVKLFATPEVHQNIIDVCHKLWDDRIDSADIIHWLLDNTCDGIEQLQPLYYSQGMDFCNRIQAMTKYSDLTKDPENLPRLVASITRKEQQSLSNLYGIRSRKRTGKKPSFGHPRLAQYVQELAKGRKGFQDTGKAVHASTMEEVEQEREIALEVESISQIKKSPQLNPHLFPGLHRDMQALLNTDHIPPGTAGQSFFIPALDSCASSAAGRKHGVIPRGRTGRVFITAEFNRTVKLNAAGPNDKYLRSARYLLLCEGREKAIFIIPEEAELIIPVLAKSRDHRDNSSGVHLLVYAAPVSRRMMQFNSLDFYAIPSLPVGWKPSPWLKAEVGLFSGRLYFDWDEYWFVCRYLGVRAYVGLGVAGDVRKELMPPKMADVGAGCGDARAAVGLDAISFPPLAKDTLAFVNDWIATHRKGQDVLHTPMGYVAQGKPLHPSNPFFRAAAGVETGKETIAVFPVGQPEEGKGAEEEFCDLEYGDDVDSGVEDSEVEDSDVEDSDVEDSEVENSE